MENTENKIEFQFGGNDILNGIERWIPEDLPDHGGLKKVPKAFNYCSPTGIWYRNKREAGTVLARAGVAPENWCAVPDDPFPETSDESEEKS